MSSSKVGVTMWHVEEKGDFLWIQMHDASQQTESSRVESSRVKSSIAGVVSPQLALVLRRLGERVRVGFDLFWFGLFCSAMHKEGQVKSRDAAIGVVSRDLRRDTRD